MSEIEIDPFVVRFREAVASGDIKNVAAMLADNVEFAPPPFWSKVRGKPMVAAILSAVFASIEKLQYRRVLRNESDYAFEFFGEADGKELQGVDLVRVNSVGLVESVDVMIRPLNTLARLMELVRSKHGALPVELSSRAPQTETNNEEG